MISKSKLGAIALIAAAGLASPAFAQMQAHAIGQGPVADPSSLHAFTPVANYGAAASGGGSAGYNRGVATDYRLKHHAKSKRAKPLHMQAAPKTAPTAPAAGAGATAPAGGGGAAKQPMGRP
jgi:hypothetical protein